MNSISKLLIALAFAGVMTTHPVLRAAPYQVENLGRGVVAMRTGASSVYVGWRLLGLDPSNIAFNVYRNGTKLSSAPIADSTNFVDADAPQDTANTYTIRPVIDGMEQAESAAYTLPANVPAQPYIKLPLQVPEGGTTPSGEAYVYNANDCSVGDLDGDGEYEIVLKWDPSNSKDNSRGGLTGNVYIDAYKLNGVRLWRIDLGRNIRAGAHYTQFQVYDLDGDGKAEVACKTADGTVSGTGQVIGDANADWRDLTPNSVSGRIGYVLNGPEFLTVFNGETGAILATTDYIPARGTITDWGDNYGNRVDRFLAATAYLDGTRPSLIICRGYYTRAAVVAWDYRDGTLTRRWTFDTGDDKSGPLAGYRGQGAHSIMVGDVDNDGKDEIVFGAATIDDDGTGLYTTGLGHGDATHLSDMDPTRPGQEVWMVHEDPKNYGVNGLEFRDAATGALIWGKPGNNTDVGRGVAADIDPNHLGYEAWASVGALYNSKGTEIASTKPSINFLVWWDADLSRELLDGNHIDDWNPATASMDRALTAAEASSINGTKSNPCLSGDILGDWREEVIWRTTDNRALHIYTTTTVATNRIYTLMHDHQYRLNIAFQNTVYNQPPHPSFYLGTGMSPPPMPNITYAGGSTPQHAVAPRP